jgi:hypothetical protein
VSCRLGKSEHGAKQASDPSNTRHHSSRVRVENTPRSARAVPASRPGHADQGAIRTARPSRCNSSA